ncbi:MAG: hypothetical protein HOV83_09775, partial [Catenulispora sp.]|nr:hypothetical protein [Catenulispora sp.]
IPIGQRSVSPLASAFGARHVAFAAGVVFLLAMAAPLALGSVRRLGTPEGPPLPAAGRPAPAAVS